MSSGVGKGKGGHLQLKIYSSSCRKVDLITGDIPFFYVCMYVNSMELRRGYD